MKWLHCVSTLIILGQIQNHCQSYQYHRYPPFLQGMFQNLPTEDDAIVEIPLPSPFPFGDTTYDTAYISSNGIISFGGYYQYHYFSRPFPVPEVPAVAAFWNDIDTTLGGTVRVTILSQDHHGSETIAKVEEYLKHQSVELYATTILIARWNDVCPYRLSPRTCSYMNSFEIILATNGNSSYAVFTYQCGSIEWGITDINASARVGFGAGSEFFVNDNVTDIDCLNEEYSDWTNIIYCISVGCRDLEIDEGAQIGHHYLPFIDLPNVTEISSTALGKVSLPLGMPFGTSWYQMTYVNGNGVMSFDIPFSTSLPTSFPIEEPVVAALWTQSNEEQLHRKYAVIDTNHGADIINRVEEYLKGKNVKLNVTLVLMARWSHASSDTEGISYVTIATDGISSYAIFSYPCVELALMSLNDGNTAIIGFSAGSDFYMYANDSIEAVTDTDCLSPNWTSMVYYVGGESCRVSCGEEGRCTGIEQCNCTEGWSIPQCDDVTKASTDKGSTSIVPLAISLTVVPTLVVLISIIAIIMIIFIIAFRRKQKFVAALQHTESSIIDVQSYCQVRSPSVYSDKVRISTFMEQVPNATLVPGTRLKLVEMIGKGEFGIVYRAILNPSNFPQPVAVKTLKDSCSSSDVDDIVDECAKMTQFNHPNVLSLMGVCVDLGPAPYIIMPFMAKGSLRNCLIKERHNLTLCDSVANGMKYLAEQSFIHRDLATRNCLIDNDDIIKVSDFGLSENIYVRRYHRQGDTAQKLPIKWMAIESLQKGLFSEKTDVIPAVLYVISFYANIFSGHLECTPQDVMDLLDKGDRLPPPGNAASSEEIYQMMRSCWRERDEERPTFASLVSTIEALMAPLAEYLPMKFE